MTYDLTTPAPMPADGMRRLTPREAMQRARAMACIRDKDHAQCQGQVYVSLFFDGTGNNKDWNQPGLGMTQTAANKHSNVARLYNAAIDEPGNGFFIEYIPGIGTPFKEIGDGGGDRGMAAGYMGADRINWGITRVFNSVHYYLTNALLFDDAMAKTIVNNASTSTGTLPLENPHRRMVLNHWEAKLAEVVQSSQRKLTQINLAVFGFSRGAACARAFANWLFELTAQDEGGYALAGVPLRVSFMGLFDTVASVGAPDAIPGFNGHMAWADGNMGISPAVEQCVHYIALHEQRASFPLEMAAGVKQVAYPGMHSDVGGGYRPGEQGKAMPAWGASPQLSQIPLIDMHHAAIVAGVPLHSSDEIKQLPFLAKDFDCTPALAKAANDFHRGCGILSQSSGEEPVLSMVHMHVRQYLQWRRGLVRGVNPLSIRRFYKEATQGQDQQQLDEGLTDFDQHMAALRQRRIHGSNLTNAVSLLADPVGTAVQRLAFDDPMQPLSYDEEAMLKAMESPVDLPQVVTTLMDEYIHDSRCAFRVKGMMEPRRLDHGYFAYRRTFQHGVEDVGVLPAPQQPVRLSTPSA